jgi:hypothetical protein
LKSRNRNSQTWKRKFFPPCPNNKLLMPVCKPPTTKSLPPNQIRSPRCK